MTSPLGCRDETGGRRGDSGGVSDDNVVLRTNEHKVPRSVMVGARDGRVRNDSGRLGCGACISFLAWWRMLIFPCGCRCECVLRIELVLNTVSIPLVATALRN